MQAAIHEHGERRERGGLWFVSPWMAGLALLYVGPMMAAGLLATARWDGQSWTSLEWSGWANFQAMATDDRLGKALLNSICYTAMQVPAQLVVGLGLALLVNQSRRRIGLWATFYYLPHVLGGVATILIWWWLLNPQVGPVNQAIRWILDGLDGPMIALGLGTTRDWDAPPWLYSPVWAKPSLVLMNLWQAGGGMLIFLAALLRGGESLHEAARLDGAGRCRRFWHITLPQVSPALMFNALTGIVFSMQAFNQPFLLRNFQQQDSLRFFSLHLYQAAFEQHRFGYAAALAWLLLAILLAFTATMVFVTRRWVQYDMGEE